MAFSLEPEGGAADCWDKQERGKEEGCCFLDFAVVWLTFAREGFIGVWGRVLVFLLDVVVTAIFRGSSDAISDTEGVCYLLTIANQKAEMLKC